MPVIGERSRGSPMAIALVCLSVRHRARPRRGCPHQAGFVLPLALAASLVLLLSSLSLQAAVLQSRRLQASSRSLQQAEDGLASAAQRLTAALQGSGRCLRGLPSAQWLLLPLPPDCPAGFDPQGLLQLQVGGQVVQLLSWEPSGDGGELRLGWGTSELQRRYSLRLTPVVALRELG